jgi:sugar porter (SP) family MFS transporter
MYIAEIAPPKWRGRLVGCFQINVVIGILLAYLSNYVIASLRLGATEWRWQLGVPAVPALLFLVALFGIPRSPRWLVMQNQMEEAAAVLRRAGTLDVRSQIAEIVESVHLEKAAARERLFSRKYAKPIFLAITVGMFCQLSGINAILYYLNDIFALAGASTMSGNLQAVAVGAMNLVATLAAMAVIDHIGRRRLLLIGTSGLVVTLAAVSVIFYTHQHMNWLVWLLLAYIACFAISQGAVIWVYVSEVFPNRVRSKGQSVGSSAHWITNAVIALVFPVMATSSGAYPFMFFAAMMVLDLFVIALYYPETSGISLEQVQHEFGIR